MYTVKLLFYFTLQQFTEYKKKIQVIKVQSKVHGRQGSRRLRSSFSLVSKLLKLCIHNEFLLILKVVLFSQYPGIFLNV